MPPGGSRGISRAKSGLKYLEIKRRNGMEIKAASINKGLSKPMPMTPPIPSTQEEFFEILSHKGHKGTKGYR
jgi:hypothetical protein